MATPKKKKTTKKRTTKKKATRNRYAPVCKIDGCENPAFFGMTTCVAHGALTLLARSTATAQKQGNHAAALAFQVMGSVAERHAPAVQDWLDGYTQGLPEPQQRIEPEMVDFFARAGAARVRARVNQAQEARARARVNQAQEARAEQKQINPFLLLHLDAKTASKPDVERVRKHFAKLYHDDKRPAGAQKDAMSRINAAADLCLAYIAKRDAQ